MKAPYTLADFRPTWRLGDTQRYLLLSILIGIFAGLLVTVFHVSIDMLSWRVLGTPIGANPWATVLGPAVGATAAAWLVRLGIPSAQGSGITYTKSAIYVSDGYIPSSSVFGKFLACALSIGSGAPLGPEDPALQMGAGVASRLGRTLRLSRDHMRQIAPVGAAAGIAAAFNTPITAVLFVIEEVLSGWDAGVLGSIVLAAVSASVVTRTFLGDEPLFQVPRFTLTDPSELLLYAGIGLAGGLAGALYTRGLLTLRARARRASPWTTPLLPLAAGLAVGVTGLLLPQVLGAGYGAIDAALHDEFPWGLLLALGVAKAILTAVCFSAGVPGGLFAPTLFVGAMLGGGIGGLAAGYWPAPTSPASAYVLVGMGTFFAAVFRTPMTSIFMVFEVSATYVIILPVMVANTVAYLVSRSLQTQSLFEGLTRQDGARFPTAEGRERRTRPVERLMAAADYPRAPRTATLGDARRLKAGAALDFLIVDGGETGEQLVRVPADPAPPDETPLDDLARQHALEELHPDDRLDDALELLGDHPVIAVVGRGAPTRVLGVLRREHVLAAYGLTAPPRPVSETRAAT
ncbi:MAG: chloride channel protein [Vicinamibacterales bacterium]|nr:chloride channel protein [Vicinamibacterales bacterium]